MKSLLLVLLLTVFASSFVMETDQKEAVNAQRIPSFLGKSYNLLKGNPLADKIDPGFGYTIFDFAYTQSRTTDDGRYMVPDFTNPTDATSCSLETHAEAFSGTLSYQQYLRNILNIDTHAGFLVESSFSFSSDFSSFTSATVKQNRTITQSNARCEAYAIDMPIFSNQIPLSEDFKVYVKESVESGDWLSFLNRYGSHFASRVIFGGRYTYQHQYQAKSMSYFASRNLSVVIGAKVQFAMFFKLEMSDTLLNYQNETKIINTMVQSQSKLMIGGQPPVGGDWIQWQNTVKDNLAPISYDLTSLSELFRFVPDIDSAKAAKDYNSFLSEYCKTHKCPQVDPDRPKPKPLKVTFSQGQSYKIIDGGNPFNTFDAKETVGMRATKVLIGFGPESLCGFQVFLNDGLTEHVLNPAGPCSYQFDYTVPKDDEIQCIRFGLNGYFYWSFVSVQFITRKGAQSDVYQNPTVPVQYYQTLCLESNDDHFIGFYGTVWVNGKQQFNFLKLGLNVMSEIYEP